MENFAEFGKAELKGWSEPQTANAYAEGFASAAEQCVADIVETSLVTNGSVALDVCCGQGIVAKGLATAGAEVIGLDFSPAMLKIARREVPMVDFVEGDATTLPFADNSFDAVTMGFGILHIPNAEAAIKEAKRVLKPGGRFVYSVWESPETSAAFRIVFGAIERFGSKDVSLPPGPPLHAFANPEYAYPILIAAGFTEPHMRSSSSVWEVSDPATPFDYFHDGTVRGALLLRSQPAENASAIRAAIARAVQAEFGSVAPWRVPIPAAIVSATA
ncbi:methyltransferase domain-containing protein [Ruegeria arenilitoris]|uniref:methyltransferase domain-containing protein n=1 Tax=Ruegeria arenilitoris TaxID=1173585 RepID=UPI001481A080|nr:methyltransferase domain-containing protein [Ruegeria arenilitoris]